MLSWPRLLTLRVAPIGFAAVAGALGVASAVVVACIASPPADLPTAPSRRPTILHDSVVPPPDEILLVLPSEFEVPVQLDDPQQSFSWNVFVDYDPVPGSQGSAPVLAMNEPAPVLVDGGVRLIHFHLDPPDPGVCLLVQFLGAERFSPLSPPTPASPVCASS